MVKEVNGRADVRSVSLAWAQSSFHYAASAVAHRGMDIVGALAGIALLALPMIAIAVLVKITSPGPVLFHQVRFGRNSKPFTMIKFRSMCVDAPQKASQHFTKKERQKFLTPIGKFLRHTSLDELPQLFNVLVGQMSFVGPRPMAETDMNVVRLRQLSGADQVRPGITGLAQIHGRNHISDIAKATYDEVYCEHISIWFDLKIMVRSVIVVSEQTGINPKSEE
ncbi:sugar transferase [Lacticaseibacillus rhamnosus]|uniref:sugar transferase n=1 Tax=Lacticaseibacillus rhamnosus TaxID=47715 RepID=UPI0021A4823C|nr:sugar transferase [Lacticaseibacillus rhamnosus]MCT3192161.1 sugar transferase [Lacticaseibacillus rhamnosus]MCT3371247.1 sugar transferase [Lacticaseibacillus rhamnosus]